MSQENVELVRRWFEAIAEGELASDLWDADRRVSGYATRKQALEAVGLAE
jgi:hypothetical protein